MKTITILAAATLAALILPGVLAAQAPQAGNTAQPVQNQPQTQQPATSPAPVAMPPAAAPAEIRKVEQDAHVIIKEEKKTEADELKMLKDQETAESAAVQARKLPASEESKQLVDIREDYAGKKRAVAHKYHHERQATRKEMKKDMKQDAKPAGR